MLTPMYFIAIMFIFNGAAAGVEQITFSPQQQTLSLGENGEIVCDTDVTSNTKWMWKHNEELLTSSNSGYIISGSILILENVTFSHGGVYQCCTEDNQGMKCSSGVVEIKLREPTASPSGFQLTWKNATAVKLTWGELEDGNGPIQGYNVSLCNLIYMKNCLPSSQLINVTTEDHQPEVMIRNLQANNLYMAMFAGYNAGGMGPWSSSEWISTNPGIMMFNTHKAPPGLAPTELRIWVANKSIKVEWEKPEFIITQVKGYRVEAWLHNETENNAIRRETEDDQVTFDLPHEGDYKVWVRAFNNGGGGKPSQAVAISTKIGANELYTGGRACAVRWNIAVTTALLLLCLLIEHLL